MIMSKPIYICVTPFFPSPSRWQGAYVLDQVKAIIRTERYKVIVFTPCSWRKQEESYVYDGITVLRVPAFFMPSYFFNGFLGDFNGRNLIKSLCDNNINLQDISVIHCHTASFACFATAIKRVQSHVKTVLQYHDPDPYQVRNGKFSTWLPNALYRAKKIIGQFEFIDLHLCISDKVKYNLINFPFPHPDEYFDSYKKILGVLRNVKTKNDMKTFVLYNGVDTSHFYPLPNMKNPCKFRIGCVANFIDWKDQMTLIKAINYLKQRGKADGIIVSFVGSGVTRKECEKYINKHGIASHFVFEQEVHHSELLQYYNSLDLFVLPSYFEGFGCVFTEAAACGVPFMGCVNQGYSEYIPDEEKNKWLIEPGNFIQLAKNIEAYMKYGYPQKLCKSYVIDELIQGYLSYIAKL